MKNRLGKNDFLVFGSPLVGEMEIDEVADCLQSGWLTAKFAKRPSEHSQIIKSERSYDHRGKFILTGGEIWIGPESI